MAKHEYPETELLKWLQFINAESKEEFEMAAEKSKYIKKAYEDLNRISADEEKRLEYEARERAIRDHQYFSTVYKETGLRRTKRRPKNRPTGGVARGVARGPAGGATGGPTGRGRVASGNGNGERNCMCKNSGKISVFSVRCSEGGRKVLEIIEEAVERYWKG